MMIGRSYVCICDGLGKCIHGGTMVVNVQQGCLSDSNMYRLSIPFSSLRSYRARRPPSRFGRIPFRGWFLISIL